MFWGLIMEAGKKYSQTVTQSFHISQACLDLDTAQNDPVQVLLSTENKNFLLCTLQRGKHVQAPLDYNFQTGSKISFGVNGPGHVHLTGYLVSDDDFDLMEEEEDDDEEVPELVLPKNKKRKASEVNQKENKVIKKSKTAMLLDEVNEDDTDDSDDSDVNLSALIGDEEEDDDEVDEEDDDAEEDDDEDDDDDDDEGEESDTEDEDENQEVKPEPKKSPKTPQQNGVVKKLEKTPKGDKTPKKQENKSPIKQENKSPNKQHQEKTPKQNKTPGGGDKSSKQGGTPKKVVAEGGVIVEDLRIGDGPQAKAGKLVQVYYEGRLKLNNKMFDSATKGAGFKFRLGKQEVIKGWDVGIKGMQVGGKRRITCPPNMAYGAQGSPPVIPPNSTLVFEVELKNVK